MFDCTVQGQMADAADKAIAWARAAIGQPASQIKEELVALLDLSGVKGGQRGNIRSKRMTQAKEQGQMRSRKTTDA
ncbi:MAG: hypothetical protein WCD18_17930 [Thermosynechococcaceae cyanobacterium]